MGPHTFLVCNSSNFYDIVSWCRDNGFHCISESLRKVKGITWLWWPYPFNRINTSIHNVIIRIGVFIKNIVTIHDPKTLALTDTGIVKSICSIYWIAIDVYIVEAINIWSYIDSKQHITCIGLTSTIGHDHGNGIIIRGLVDMDWIIDGVIWYGIPSVDEWQTLVTKIPLITHARGIH